MPEETANKTGVVYQIRNTLNEHRYVGSTADVKRRKDSHFYKLRYGRHHCRHLQFAFNKYGSDNFVFEIIEEVSLDNLIVREQFWIDTLAPEYNTARVAGSSLGIKRTAETKARISAARMGKRHFFSPESIAKLSAAKMGNTHTKGYRLSEEHKAKIGAGVSKPISQLDKTTGEVIREWQNAELAAKEFGVSASTIRDACTGKSKSAVGYRWKRND